MWTCPLDRVRFAFLTPFRRVDRTLCAIKPR
jgi:hypothetical protein